MSEKGVLSKSIASNISEAIIDKLGGTGYSPTEWSRNINLLGISSADIADALASITEDTSSSDKGLLSLSIASDVGAMLNKKYNTSRGFKPCEVSSAVSALTVLPEKTASSAPICTFSDGADDVPLKSCEVALSASLDGYSSVDVVQMGKNLLDESTIQNGWQINSKTGYPSQWNGRCATTSPITIHGGNITVSYSSTDSLVRLMYSFFKNGTFIERVVNIESGTTINAHDYDTMYIGFANVNGTTITKDVLSNVQIEVGSTVTAYTEYAAPTTYTANLGRTIYGGSVDVVKGEGTDENGNDFTFEPVEISSRLGNNTMWSDGGDTKVTYRADLDLYEAPSTLLGSNNTETEGNEEQEVNE